MRQKLVLPEQQSRAAKGGFMSAYVAEARHWAINMVRRESRGSGDRDRAMEAVARRCGGGVTPSLIRSLHYRPPKNLLVTAYFAIASAYQAECEKQRKLLEHEIEITAAKVGVDSSAVGAARALVGETSGVLTPRE
jgi:hypothetical protein